MVEKENQEKHGFDFSDMEVVEGFVFPKSNDLFKIKRYIESADVESLLQSVCDIIYDEGVVIQHPLLGVATKACYSLPVLPNANAVLFVSYDKKEWWIALQINNFIDAVIVEDKIYIFTKSSNVRLVLNHVRKLLGSLELDSKAVCELFDMNLRFEGFALGIPRPFHSFYDHLMYVKPLIDLGLLDNKKISVYNDVFFDIKKIFNSLDVVTYVPGLGVYLNLSFVRALYFQKLRVKQFNGMARKFEDLVLNSCLHDFKDDTADRLGVLRLLDNAKSTSLGLWVGVTGQKRSWVQQVEGYSKIIKAVSQYFDKIFVFIDGITSPVGRVVDNKEDNDIFKIIKQNLKECGNVSCINMVGKAYEEKIILCYKNIDFFIANAGTGAVVPLRFCRKPGVIHSNSSLMSFPDEYGDSVKVVAGGEVLESFNQDNVSYDRVSYYVAWEVIYNCLADLMNKSLKYELQIDFLEQKSPYGELDEKGVEAALNFLDERFKKAGDSADGMRELALFFEMTGDFEKAYQVMCLAKMARPNGPFINRKIAEYSAILENLDKRD